MAIGMAENYNGGFDGYTLIMRLRTTMVALLATWVGGGASEC